MDKFSKTTIILGLVAIAIAALGIWAMMNFPNSHFIGWIFFTVAALLLAIAFVIHMDWNKKLFSQPEKSGHDESEWVATMRRNDWPQSSEYALGEPKPIFPETYGWVNIGFDDDEQIVTEIERSPGGGISSTDIPIPNVNVTVSIFDKTKHIYYFLFEKPMPNENYTFEILDNSTPDRRLNPQFIERHKQNCKIRFDFPHEECFTIRLAFKEVAP